MSEKKKHKMSIIPKYGDYIYPSANLFEDDRKDVVYFGPENKWPRIVTGKM